MSKCLPQVSKHFIRWEHTAWECAPSPGAAERPLFEGGYLPSTALPKPCSSGGFLQPTRTSGEKCARKRKEVT